MYRFCIILILLASVFASCTSPTSQTAEEKQDPNVTPEGIRITPDVVYGHKFGMALTFDLYQPKSQNGAAVIIINSGGWSSSFPSFYQRTSDGIRLNEVFGSVRLLLEKGFTIFSVRHGSSPKFEMNEIVSDLRSALRFIRFHAGGYGIDAERLGVVGGSSGGHLSLLLATTSEIRNAETTEAFEQGSGRIASVVAYFPPTDLKKFIEFSAKNNPDILKALPVLDLSEAQLIEFSPINFVTSDDPPTLIILGDKDPAIPIDQGESMHQELLKAGVESKFVIIPGAGHGFEGEDDKLATAELVSWFEKHLP
jgi:acetyl esterase/lipase